MNQLVKELIRPLLEQEGVTALYGGGFKPPTKGHFDLVKKALDNHPEIDKFIIYVGGGTRDGIGQEQALEIWDIYKDLLGDKVEIIPSSAPIGDIVRYARDNSDEKVYFIIGAREGRDDDMEDVATRTKGIEDKYPNTSVKLVTTPDAGMSGTNARKAIGDTAKFIKYLPSELQHSEKEKVYNIVSKSLLKEHSMGNSIDLKSQIDRLTQHMIDKGYNIEPLPSLEFVDDDITNAEDFLGKTAYYNPDTQTIVLYTHGRHPKDIARSYAHEMIHHIQNLEGRLGDITTTNTQEDDKLNKLEAEANLKGTMTFRNWTDSLNEDTTIDLVQQFRQEAGFQQCNIYDKRDNCGPTALDFISWAESKGIKDLKRINGYFKADIPVSTKRDFTREMKQEFLNDGGDWNNAKDRFEWISNSQYSEQWKYIPHYWVENPNGKIYDPVGQQQFIDAGYSKDLNPDRYTLTDSLQEKKNKDPFGLNQFARELMAEGAYDSLVTQLTKATIQKWVADFKKNPKLKSSFIDLDIEDVDGKGRDIEFNYVGMLKFDKKVDGYVVDGTSNSGEEEDKIPFIATLFTVNPKVLPQAWSQMSADVSDVIRHEIEHLTQSGENVRSGKYMDDDIMIRDMINKLKILPKSDYYKLEKEVDAMLQGLYLKAKKTRKPFADVINNYLDIAPGIETKEDKEIILNLWRSRRKALSLPLFEEEEVMNYTIYSDMDGVLSDFDKRFMEFSDGIPPGQYEQRKGREEFWKLIDDTVGVPFWAGMDWMPDGKEYWSYIEKYNPIILSAPSKNEESKYGKRIWKKRNMPNNKMILVPAWKKKEYATPTSILIDDRADNINQWEAAGGIGILHTDAASTIAKLKELGL